MLSFAGRVVFDLATALGVERSYNNIDDISFITPGQISLSEVVLALFGIFLAALIPQIFSYIQKRREGKKRKQNPSFFKKKKRRHH